MHNRANLKALEKKSSSSCCELNSLSSVVQLVANHIPTDYTASLTVLELEYKIEFIPNVVKIGGGVAVKFQAVHTFECLQMSGQLQVLATLSLKKLFKRIRHVDIQLIATRWTHVSVSFTNPRYFSELSQQPVESEALQYRRRYESRLPKVSLDSCAVPLLWNDFVTFNMYKYAISLFIASVYQQRYLLTCIRPDENKSRGSRRPGD